LHHVRTVEANAKFKAWHPRLGHHEFCRADAKAITNMKRFLKQALFCEGLAENSPRKISTENITINPQSLAYDAFVDNREGRTSSRFGDATKKIVWPIIVSVDG